MAIANSSCDQSQSAERLAGTLRADRRRAARCDEPGDPAARARALTFRDSYMSSLELRDTFPERDERALGFLYRPHALRRDLKKSLRAAAALGRRLADRRRHQAVAFEPIERRVDRGDDDAAAAGGSISAAIGTP